MGEGAWAWGGEWAAPPSAERGGPRRVKFNGHRSPVSAVAYFGEGDTDRYTGAIPVIIREGEGFWVGGWMERFW
ncbi:hypothetical protein CEXT_326191 [Caerostris extrusa]|uniref:Uncharacterized protein n=1 Tax=Caerostris extrusa TaxID=172846 RepID=A0AAV4V7S3_CAEEX|nr:hypothetical protein CEXT_326191 [Caerostris extrusa]